MSSTTLSPICPTGRFVHPKAALNPAVDNSGDQGHPVIGQVAYDAYGE